MSSKGIYLTEIIDSQTGKSRSIYLHDGILTEEWKELFQTVFEFDAPTVGFKDEAGVFFTNSFVTRAPKLFHNKKLLVVFEHANVDSKTLPSIGSDSEDTLVTEEHVEFVFNTLDKNQDGKIHKEEFIEVMWKLFEHLFYLDAKLAFSYSCMTTAELAVSAANSCYGSIFEDSREDGYYLDYADFSSWYMSGGNDPLKVLVITAFQLFQSEHDSGRTLRRQKSTPQLNFSKYYDDSAVSSFFALGRRMLSFSDNNLSLVCNDFSKDRKKSHFISHEQTKSIISSLLEESVAANLSKTEVVEIVGRFMQTVIEILDDQGTGNVHIGQLFSLLQLTNDAPDLRVFKSIFFWYRASNESKGMAFETVLFDHLKTVTKVIVYFNTKYSSICTPDYLAHAVFLKLLLSVEVSRKSSQYLSLNEFVELFVHGLRLVLSSLQISDGYFEDLLSKLVGYHVESIRGDTSCLSPVVDSNIGVMSPTGDSLEDDQVSSYMVGYNGTTVSVEEAREALGLYEYTGYDMVKYIMQLSDDKGKIDSITFTRGVLKLIGEHYVLLSVLQRSVVDFILDRFATTFDSRQENRFDMLEVCIALLLFCEDDEYSRPEVILALLRPKVLKFSTVRAVVVILFQMCYALNPSASPAVLSADAESDANTMCIAYYMRNVSSKADMLVNFSNAQFLDFMALVLSFLEEESIRRRNSGEDVVTYDEEGTSEPDDAKSEESKNANLRSFSEDEASDECIPYLDDKQYPPSPVVLELRAASSVLGLEHYSADDLIDKLGGESTAGRLDHHGWARWLGTVFQVGKVSEFDIDLAIFIGHKIFNAFQHDEQRTVRFSHLAIGLAFLCTKSPLEERLMVAFTLADEDSDGFLTFHDFCTLIKSVLTVISVCSKLIAGKISTLNVTLAELSREAALQGMKALGLEENDDINLEMLSDLTEDFLKLTAFV
jgi:Ca2+-binding EF-hand superfamily protein